MENKKNQFLRTVPGKFLLFLIINILVIVTFGCVCASAVCIQEDLYDITEEEFYQKNDESFIYYTAMSETENLLGIQNYHVENISIEVKDKDGKLITSTRDYKDVSEAAGKPGEFENYKLYTFDMRLVYDKTENTNTLMTIILNPAIQWSKPQSTHMLIHWPYQNTLHSTNR